MTATRQTIEKKANAKGAVFALVSDGVTFEVWKLCENYDGQCRGGNRKTWRYLEKGMTEENARKLFKRRTK